MFPEKKPVAKTAQLNATEPERIHPRDENKTTSIPKPLVRSIGQGEAQLALGGGSSTVVEPRRAAQEESAGLRRRREVLQQQQANFEEREGRERMWRDTKAVNTQRARRSNPTAPTLVVWGSKYGDDRLRFQVFHSAKNRTDDRG
ncbi:hypothetical protein HO133_008119 [Letharia lupina]|uniref:Uncharacterized protein n=1 Tax=Letharia lupina TaxID=560253 RepID=A0A8H6CRK8_9LECA|nr:uncharacterized protein HO133_008119 [Letharia lupina]KAF6228389.1 hypothetical protein HO133_008119 [Letharia lupina]